MAEEIKKKKREKMRSKEMEGGGNIRELMHEILVRCCCSALSECEYADHGAERSAVYSSILAVLIHS